MDVGYRGRVSGDIRRVASARQGPGRDLLEKAVTDLLEKVPDTVLEKTGQGARWAVQADPCFCPVLSAEDRPALWVGGNENVDKAARKQVRGGERCGAAVGGGRDGGSPLMGERARVCRRVTGEQAKPGSVGEVRGEARRRRGRCGPRARRGPETVPGA